MKNKTHIVLLCLLQLPVLSAQSWSAEGEAMSAFQQTEVLEDSTASGGAFRRLAGSGGGVEAVVSLSDGTACALGIWCRAAVQSTLVVVAGPEQTDLVIAASSEWQLYVVPDIVVVDMTHLVIYTTGTTTDLDVAEAFEWCEGCKLGKSCQPDTYPSTTPGVPKVGAPGSFLIPSWVCAHGSRLPYYGTAWEMSAITKTKEGGECEKKADCVQKEPCKFHFKATIKVLEPVNPFSDWWKFDSDAGDQEACVATANDTVTIERKKRVQCNTWAHVRLKVRNGTDRKTYFVCINCLKCIN